MFRKNNLCDLTDEEYNNSAKPHLKRTDLFLETYVIPEYSAYFIATGYYTNSIWEDSFETTINSTIDIFEYEIKDYNKFVDNVKTLLKHKYSLKTICESPIFTLEEINFKEDSNV